MLLVFQKKQRGNRWVNHRKGVLIHLSMEGRVPPRPAQRAKAVPVIEKLLDYGTDPFSGAGSDL